MAEDAADDRAGHQHQRQHAQRRLQQAHARHFQLIGAEHADGPHLQRDHQGRERECQRCAYAEQGAERERFRVNSPDERLRQEGFAIGVDEAAEQHAAEATERAAQDAQPGRFGQEERRYLPPFEAEGLERGDLQRPMAHAHQHRVDDANTADEQGAHTHHGDEIRQQGGEDFVAAQQFRCAADVIASAQFALEGGRRRGDIAARRQGDADAVWCGILPERIRFRKGDISEAEEGSEDVQQARFALGRDDAADDIRRVVAAERYAIADAQVTLGSEVLADDEAAWLGEEGLQGFAAGFARGDFAGDAVGGGVDEQQGDELWAADATLALAEELDVARFAVGHPLRIGGAGGDPGVDAREGRFIEGSFRVARAGGQASEGVIAAAADAEVTMVAAADVGDERIADAEAERAQGDDRRHTGSDGEEAEGGPAPFAPQVARRIAQVEEEALPALSKARHKRIILY